MPVSDASRQLGLAGFVREMGTALRRQGNVILALMFKEFRSRASRGRLGLFWVILDPVTKIIVLSLFWYLVRRTEISGVHVALFIAVAVVPFTIVSRSLASIASAIGSNQAYYNYPQVKPIDALIARFLLDMWLLAMGAAAIFFALDWFMGLQINLQNILPFVGVLVLAMALGFGVSLFTGTYSSLYESFSKVQSLFHRPLLLISAVFYTPNDLPAQARYFISWNPIAQLIEYARYYALGIPLFPEASIVYPAVCALVALFLGFIAYYANRFRLLER